MSISHLLDDFGTGGTASNITISDVSLEDERLAAFETGYKAGWDDAAKAQQEDQRRISADLAANLQELSFTYHEVQSGLLAELKPLLTGMVETVLPRLAHATLVPRIVEILQETAHSAGGAPAEIVTAPANVARIEAMLDTQPDFPVTVHPEDTLSEGQVHIRFGSAETEIDLSAVLAGIDRAVADFFATGASERNTDATKEIA